MHSLGQRLMNVLGAMTSSLLIYSAMLIATTLVMNFVNFPMPTFHGISWSMSGAREAEQQILVGIPFGNNASWINMVESRDRSGRFAYYNAGGQLDSNVYYISPDETDFPFRAKEIARVFGLVPAVRSVYQARILVSGVFDFSKCWNWNTKAIYVSIVASYITPKSDLNEVTVCDSVIRIAYPPSGLQAAVNEAQRAYRTSSNSSISLKESDWKVYLSTENQQVLQDFEKDIANEHDTAGKTDHINKRVYYNQSIKYALTDFYNKPVSPKNITLTVRYQVMSTTGWSPLQVSRFSAEGSF